jgi:hypothetical protein
MIDEEYIDNLGRLSTKEYIKRKESYEDKYDKLAAKLYEYGTYDDDLRSAAYETIVVHGGNADNVDIVELKQLLDEYNEADIKFKEAREKHRRNMKMIEKIKRYGGSNGDDDYYDYGGDDDDDYYDYGGDDDYYDYYSSDDDYYDYGGNDDYESKKSELEQKIQTIDQKTQKVNQLKEKIDQQGKQSTQVQPTSLQQKEQSATKPKEKEKQLTIQPKEKEKQPTSLQPKQSATKPKEKEKQSATKPKEKEKQPTSLQPKQSATKPKEKEKQPTSLQPKQSATKPRPAPPPRKKTVPTRKQTISDTDDIIKTKVKLYEKLIKHLKLLNDVYNESSFDDDIKNKYDDIEFNDSQQHSDDLQDLIDMFESGPNKHDESDEYEGIPDEILDEYYDDIRKLIKYEGLNINAINTAYNDHRDDFIEKLINGDNSTPSDYPKDIPIKTKYLIHRKQQPIVRRTEQQQSTREQSQRGRGKGRVRGIGQPSTQVKPTGRKRFPPIQKQQLTTPSTQKQQSPQQQPTKQPKHKPKQPTSTPPQSSSQSTTRQSIPKQPPQKTGGF